MNKSLAIVTGSSRGLGLAFSEACLADGFQLLALSRNKPDLNSDRLEFKSLDISDCEAVENFCQSELSFTQDFDHVVLINNAGTLGQVGAGSDAKSLRSTYALNVISPLILTQWLLKNSKAKRVSVVNISSGAAHSPYPGWMEYCSTKAGFLMASQVIWRDYQEGLYPSRDQLNIFDYAPGVVNTAMQAEIRSGDASDFPNLARFKEMHESGQLVEPGDSVSFILDEMKKSRESGYASLRYTAN